MAPDLTITFNSTDILDSGLYSGGSHVYTVSTSHGTRSREITKLMYGNPSAMAGEINWRDECFVIAGFYQSIKSSKGWFGGIGVAVGIPSNIPAKDGQYGQLHNYLILGLTDGALFTKAKSGSRGEVAHYTPHAAIWISPEFEDQVEIIFLILVFLYSETKRLDGRGLLRRPNRAEPVMALDRQLTFNSTDILDSQLYSGGSHVYTTYTSHGRRGREVTKLMSGIPSAIVPAGNINWRDQSLEIAESYQKIERSRGWSGSWKWGGPRYTLKYSRKKWTAKTGSRGGSEVAHYYTPHGAIWISPAIEDQVEIIFLILVFLYSETQRLDNKEAREEMVAAAADELAQRDGGGGGGGDDSSDDGGGGDFWCWGGHGGKDAGGGRASGGGGSGGSDGGDDGDGDGGE